MSCKTLTISEEAYKRLLKEKGSKESFTDVIIKLTSKRRSLLEVVRKLGSDNDLADSIEKIYSERFKYQ